MTVRGVKLDRLVKSPLKQFGHLTGDGGYLTSHLKNSFHEDSVSRAAAFMKVQRVVSSDVAQQMNAAAASERERNRRALG